MSQTGLKMQEFLCPASENTLLPVDQTQIQSYGTSLGYRLRILLRKVMLALNSRAESLGYGYQQPAPTQQESVPQPTGPIHTTTAAGKKLSLLSLPLELHYMIIEHLEMTESIHDASEEMRAKWALKRTCRHFWAFDNLSSPSDFFRRNYADIKLDREKQWKIIATFGPRSSFGLAPCYSCCRWLRIRDIATTLNGGSFFWEGRTLSCCWLCWGRLAQLPNNQLLSYELLTRPTLEKIPQSKQGLASS
jgi:hypothetical protein